MGNYRYDTEVITQNPILKDIIKPRKSKPGMEQYLNNYTLDKLVREFCQNNTVIDKLHQLYIFEHGSRNLYAHTIVRVNKEEIESGGGMTMEEVMQSLLELNEVRPGLYKRINEAICKLL